MNTRRDEIYESITRRELIGIAAAGGLIGLVIFCVLYGVDVINVTNDGWLLAGGDLTQHYVGWKFFRNSDWHFPIGIMDGLVYPQQICVIFTDSIPLFALFFKLLSPILPDTFQYFGLWGMLSYILMGAVSAVIMRKGTKNPAVCVISSVFFSFSPYVIQRMFRHTALAGNWLILLAIAIWIYKPWFRTFKRKTIAWGLLLVAASLVHIYYIPMIMLFLFFSCLQDLLENNGWKADIAMGCLVVLADLAVLYCVGAFSSTTKLSGEGLGLYSANLNTLWNPLGKGRFLSSLPIMSIGQDEGYGYLGLGMLILGGIAVVSWIVRFSWKILKRENMTPADLRGRIAFPVCVLMMLLTTVVLAAGPEFTYDQEILTKIDYPDKILEILSIFRASGRFIWCAGYMLMFFILLSVASLLRQKWAVLAILSAAVCLQVADLQLYARSGGYVLARGAEEKEILNEEDWEAVLEGKEHMTFIPFSLLSGTQEGSDAMYAFANLAVDHDMTINWCTVARADVDRATADDSGLRQALAAGNRDKTSVYILDSKETGEYYQMNVQVIDGYIVGTY